MPNGLLNGNESTKDLEEGSIRQLRRLKGGSSSCTVDLPRPFFLELGKHKEGTLPDGSPQIYPSLALPSCSWRCVKKKMTLPFVLASQHFY